MKRIKTLLTVAVAGVLAFGRAVAEPFHGFAMPALLQSDTDKGQKPMPVCAGSETVTVREEIALAANPGAGDILAMVDLPADHVPVDCILDADDVDTNGVPTVTLDVGVLNAAKDNIDVGASSGGGKWITASNVGQAGGLARPTAKFITRVTPSSANRKVGVRVEAASATFAAGKVGLTFSYRAAHFGK